MRMPLWPLVLVGVENFVLVDVVLCVFTLSLAALVRLRARTCAWRPLSMSRVYAAALILPAVGSAWIVVASLFPAIWLGTDRWGQEHQAPHTLHLLNAFTVPLDPILGYAAVGFAVLAVVFAAHAGLSAYFRIGGVVRRLDIGAEPGAPDRIEQVELTCRQRGIDVGLVVSHYPFSFVWGYFRSKLVISTGLLNALSSKELATLLEHEAAHHERRDNLMKWVLTVCRYSSPAFPLTQLLYRWWSEQVEMICDEVAARRTSAPVELAEALTRLRRLTLSAPARSVRPIGSRFLGERSESFERRVVRVLSLVDQSETSETMSSERSWVRAAALAGAACASSLAIIFMVSPLAIHRVIEAILHAF